MGKGKGRATIVETLSTFEFKQLFWVRSNRLEDLSTELELHKTMHFYNKTQPILPRPQPMRVLFLSLPRTGTTCMNHTRQAEQSCGF